MPIIVLAVDSNFEPWTKAAFDYRQRHVYPYLERKGFTAVRCQGPLARRYYVAPEARRPNVAYVTGVGHGSEDTYTGDQYSVIFRVGDYGPEECERKIVHFLSCQTARALGKDRVAHGCRAFFGYDVDFTFTTAAGDLFFECDSEIDRVVRLYSRRIAELRAAGHLYVAAILEMDRDHLRAPSSGPQWGDRQARLA
jgi:hypothetical protein